MLSCYSFANFCRRVLKKKSSGYGLKTTAYGAGCWTQLPVPRTLSSAHKPQKPTPHPNSNKHKMGNRSKASQVQPLLLLPPWKRKPWN